MRGFVCTTIGAGGVALTFGCTALRSATDTYGTTQGNLSTWSCLGQPTLQAATVPPVRYRTDVVDWVTGGPPSGLEVCVCAQVDIAQPQPDAGVVACDMPLGDAGCFNPPILSNVAIDLPPRSDIYMAFLAQKTVPDSLYFNRPPTSDLDGRPPIRLITFATAQSLAESFGLMLDPTLGLVVMRVFDCNGNPAPGVRFTIEPAPSNLIPFAYSNDAPSPLLKSTDITGQFGFGNAIPGSAKASAFLTNGTDNDLTDDTPIGSVTFTVRAGWATLVDFRQ
jgi:hypothetical protein